MAFYENIGRGVMVFDFNPPTESDRIKFIPADNGATGVLSPDVGIGHERREHRALRLDAG
ncbi:MAG: hypothetical protein MUF38_15715 [Anaerolineae bacterium]|nr:hypothetical protein [Anaerolineae bacterium]